MKRIEVNKDLEECVDADAFWEILHDLHECMPSPLAPLATDAEPLIIMTDEEAVQVWVWLEKIPGWSSKQYPKHASHPLLFMDL